MTLECAIWRNHIAVCMLAGACLAPLAPVESQTIVLVVGAEGRTVVAPGGHFTVPLTADMSSANGQTLGSLSTAISWNNSRLTLDSLKSGGFGSLISNVNAADGTGSLSAFDGTGTATTAQIATLYFTASAVVGSTSVQITPGIAGNAGGTDIHSQLRLRNLDICVASQAYWGDANGDGGVNIIDAQQIARATVGLPIGNATALASLGDVNADGNVNIIDAQQIARFTVGLPATARVNSITTRLPAVASLSISQFLEASGGGIRANVQVDMSALPVSRMAQIRPLAIDAARSDVTACAAITYASSNPLVVTADPGGLVTAVSPGNATITLSSGGHSVTVDVTTVAPASMATKLVLATSPSISAESGVLMPVQPIVEVRDMSDALAGDMTVPVTASITSGAGSLYGHTTVNTVNGVATFSDLNVVGSGPHVLSFSSPGLTSATANVTSTQVVRQLAIRTAPLQAESGMILSPQPVIELRDAAGLVVPASTATVTASIATGTGALSGSTAVNGSAGVVTYSDLTITGSGSFTFRFSTPGLADVMSAALSLSVPALGSLDMTILGLPSGAAAAGQVSGPGNTNRSATMTAVIESLPPGVYSVTFQNVWSDNGVLYLPDPSSQPITVTAGIRATATVTYRPHFGTLNMTVSGAPSGVAANGILSGPNNFNRAVMGSTTIGNLNPGAYMVTFASISKEGVTYVPEPTVQFVTIVADEESRHSVVYTATTPSNGSVAVTIESSNLVGNNTTMAAAVVRDMNGTIVQNPSITWSSSAPFVASVDANGNIRALGAGTTEISAMSGSATASRTISVAPAPASFNTDVRYLNLSLPSQGQADVLAARQLWQSVIRSGGPPDHVRWTSGQLCPTGPNAVPIPLNVNIDEPVQSVLVYVQLKALPSSTLAQTTICQDRTASHLPVLAVIDISAENLNAMLADGRFKSVIAHEMGHALGFGNEWAPAGLIDVSDPSDPVYTGKYGVYAYSHGNFARYFPGRMVPVERGGTAGSVGSHWRESEFDRELMTSVTEDDRSVMPLSVLTIGAMMDLGYVVNFYQAQSDPLSFFTPLPAQQRGSGRMTTPER
jgi:hypothetical protein